MNKLPSQAELQRLFSYNPVTGLLRWRISIARRIIPNSIAGSVRVDSKGMEHIQVEIYGTKFYAHRIIWKYITGSDPSHEIDHEDGNGLHNMWSNLREATDGQQKQNSRPNRGKKLKGAYRSRNKWKACINYRGCLRYLGTFNTEQEAHNVYVAEALRVYGSFARAS